MAFVYNPSTKYCKATDSCFIGFTHACTNIIYEQGTSFSHDFSIYPDRFDSSKVHWKFVLSNRFGFSDSLEGTSIIKSPTLSCKNPQVDFCQPMIVYPRERHLFSWVEGYADGRRDTIFSSDSSRWPGYASTKLTSSSYTAVIFTIDFMRVVDTVQVCPGDSLVLDSLGGYPTLYAKPDTIHLNYSADSLFPFILLEVQFAEKDALIAHASTAQYFTNSMNLNLEVNHFKGDSAIVELLNSSPHYVYWSTTAETYCPAQDPCSNAQITACDEIIMADASTWPHLGITIDSTTSGDFPWKLIVRNRFGFADTVSGTTKASPFSCM